MKKLLALIAVPALLLSTGCGGNYCTRSESLQTSFEEKHKACDGAIREGTFDVKACEEDLKSCSDEDQEKLNNFLDCVEGIRACEAGKENELSASVLICAFSTSGMSDACSQIIFGAPSPN